MSVLKGALVYFLLAFGWGFVLGPLREFVLKPRLGEVAALLIEAPLMLVVVWLLARWLWRRMPATREAPLATGLLALVFLLAAELIGAVLLRGLSPMETLARYGTPFGAISLALFAAFAAMPWFVTRRAPPRSP